MYPCINVFCRPSKYMQPFTHGSGSNPSPWWHFHWLYHSSVIHYACVFISTTDAVALSLAPFGQGLGPIWLDNLACNGNEERLIDCGYDAHTADCAHFEDAGLRCLRKAISTCTVLLVFHGSLIYCFRMLCIELLALWDTRYNWFASRKWLT